MNDPHTQQPDHQRLLHQAMAQSPADAAASHGPAAPSVAELAVLFPDYEVLELIGRGGMGAVYKAMHRNLQRAAAIKVLPRELATDPEFGERFLREARTLATLNHPGIIAVHDYGERDGTFFLITEFVDGVNLRQLMELGELSPAEALRIAPQICIALEFAHERGVVHRDVKPENILIDCQGQVKIADFGLAKATRPGDQVALTRSSAVFGTPHYMAPEQWQGASLVDHRADIYSVGVVLYEMLTGHLPLGHFDPPSQRKGVPRGLDAVVRRALAQQPENRYQHARDVHTDVERQARELNEKPIGNAREPEPANPGARMVKAPIAAIVAVLLAVGAVFFLTHLEAQGYRQAHRFGARMGSYHESAQAAALQARDDLPVTATAQLPSPPTTSWLAIDAIAPLIMSLAAGVLLLLMAVGFTSIRTIRHSNGTRTGLALAVGTAWALPLTVVGLLVCAPLTALSKDVKVVVGILLVGAVLYGSARFLLFETRRQRELVRTHVPMRHGAGWLATAWVIALMAIGNAAAVPFYLPSEPADHQNSIGPTFANDLLGKSRSQVLALIGPPATIGVAPNSESWAYANEHGQMIHDALVFSGRSVVTFERDSRVLVPNEIDLAKPHVGQSIDVFVKAYGAPTSRTDGFQTTSFTFGNDITAVVRSGIVVGTKLGK